MTSRRAPTTPSASASPSISSSPLGNVEAAAPCSLCKRMIINAGIEKVVVRDTATTYRLIDVYESWVNQDASMEQMGY